MKKRNNVIQFYQKRITTIPNCIPDELNGKYGIINVKTKETIIPYEYDYCWFFMEYGWAQVRKNGKWGFINSSNKVVIPIEYDSLGVFGFQSGLCLVEKNGKCGFIDKNNNLVIPLKYGVNSNEFHNGIASVELLNDRQNQFKYINSNDEFVTLS